MSKTGIYTKATRAVNYKELKVTSTAFLNEAMIPSKYTCDGRNVNPSLEIQHIPGDAKCLALIVDDQDTPVNVWVHWIAWNIPVTHHINENDVHGIEGVNDFQVHSYRGPCPPSGKHRYFFKVYALDALLDLPVDSKKIQLEKAMSEHIIGFGELTGCYTRNK